MIYTSYYGNLKNLPLEKCLAISQGVPSFYEGAKDVRLAPPWHMVRNAKDYEPEEWRNIYFQQLDRFDPEEIAMIVNEKILLCWEKPGDRCHRHYVIDWLRFKGISVTSMEWGNDQESFL